MGDLDTKIEQLSFTRLFGALDELPALVETCLRLQKLQESCLAEIADLKKRLSSSGEDKWLDAKEAAKYMGISPGSFDKYRYSTTPSLKGAKLDGKVLYKKSDLDDFIMLYEVKSQGLRKLRASLIFWG